MTKLTFLGLLVFAMAACHSQSAQQAVRESPRATNGVGACTGHGDEVRPVRNYPIRDQTVQGFIFINRQTTACTVAGYPRVNLLDAKMRVIPLRLVDDGTVEADGRDATVVSTLGPLGYFISFFVEVTRVGATPCWSASFVKVTLPGHDYVMTARAAEAGTLKGCGDTIHLAPLYPPPLSPAGLSEAG